MLSHLVIAGLAAGLVVSASLELEARATDVKGIVQVTEYIDSICYPKNTVDYPVLDAPCWGAQAIKWQCTYNTSQDFVAMDNGVAVYGHRGVLKEYSPKDQRACFCQSAYFERAAGCGSCFAAHGFDDGRNTKGKGLLSSISSSYCAITNTPTAGLAKALATAYPSSITAAYSRVVSSIHDPIGSSTAESYYWTNTETGSGLYTVTKPTSGAVAATASGGQIVRPKSSSARAITSQASQSQSQTASTATATVSSTSSGNGALPTAAVQGPLLALGALGAVAAFL